MICVYWQDTRDDLQLCSNQIQELLDDNVTLNSSLSQGRAKVNHASWCQSHSLHTFPISTPHFVVVRSFFTRVRLKSLGVCVQISELEALNFSLEEMLMEAQEGEGEGEGEGEEGEEVDGGREERRGRSATLIETALKEKDEVKIIILLSSCLLEVLPIPFFQSAQGFFNPCALEGQQNFQAKAIYCNFLSLSLFPFFLGTVAGAT